MAQAAAYKVFKKKNGRYAVRKRGGGYLSGLDKTKFLLDKKLIKTTLPKEPEPEAPAEEAAAEAPAEEAPAEG